MRYPKFLWGFIMPSSRTIPSSQSASIYKRQAIYSGRLRLASDNVTISSNFYGSQYPRAINFREEIFVSSVASTVHLATPCPQGNWTNILVKHFFIYSRVETVHEEVNPISDHIISS